MDFFKNADEKDNPNVAKLWARMNENRDRHIIKKVSEFEGILREDPYAVYFGQEFMTEYEFQSLPCIIDSAPDSEAYFDVGTSIALEKESPYVELFNYYLIDMRESGLVQRIINKYQHEKRPPKCSVASVASSYKPIEWQNIFTAFFMLGLGILLAAMTLCLEMYWEIRREKDSRVWQVMIKSVPLVIANTSKRTEPHNESNFEATVTSRSSRVKKTQKESIDCNHGKK